MTPDNKLKLRSIIELAVHRAHNGGFDKPHDIAIFVAAELKRCGVKIAGLTAVNFNGICGHIRAEKEKANVEPF